MDTLSAMYATMQALERRFVDAADSIILGKNSSTRLQSLRRSAGLSQSQLATRSGVNLRTLQQYESRAKDINKAAGSTLLALSQALYCKIESILEPNFEETPNMK